MKVFSLFFTGISGSGKTSLATALTQKLMERNISVEQIDGDQLRTELGNLFGYTRDERMKNSRVVRLLAKYLNRNGICTVTAVVAPYEEMRRQFRSFLGSAYIEVYVKCSYEKCAERDVKGYYKKQLEGGLSNLNGADDVFEPPLESEIVVDTEHNPLEVCVGNILDYLEEQGYAVPIHS